MSETFDIGPLSWVKDEIDQSLKKVMDNYIVVTEHPADYASLRFTLAHLYQVSGALDMVGLEGCKRYCAELEKLTTKVEKGDLPATAALMEDLMLAVQTLSQYLQDLLNGAPDTPTRLYDSLNHLVTLQGETLEMTDLFYPDTSFSPPKDLPVNPIAASALPIFVAEQRGIFQKSLLDWLMTKDAQALARMKNALFNVQLVQQKKSQKSLWWVATAFTEALAQEKVAALAGAKKLCRKLDQQLRNMSLGESKVPTHLLRDVLYYVAISERSTAQISKVKDVYALDAILPSDAASTKPILITSDAERAAVAQLLAELPHLKELWIGVSEFVAEKDVAKQVPVEELQSVTLKLQLLLENMQNQGVNHQNINNQHLIHLMDATQQVSQQLLTEISQLNETAVLEVASALNLLEVLADTYAFLAQNIHDKVTQQIKRLQHILSSSQAPLPSAEAITQSGLGITQTTAALSEISAEAQEPFMGALDATLVEAVASQMMNALREVEKSIDGFFRQSSLTSGLDQALRPLNQVVAAFDMLEMPTPKTIAKLSVLYIEQFKANAPEYATPHPNHDQFNLLAEAISLIGLYAQDLPEVRAESKHALSECLQRLEEGLQLLQVADEGDASEEVELTVDAIAPSTSIQTTAEDATPAILSVVEIPAEATPNKSGLTDDFVEIARFTDAEVTDKAIDRELQDIFIAEAQELLEHNSLNLQALHVNASNGLALVELRRAFHTLKGSGRTVGLEGMGDVAHAIEKLLYVVIEHKTQPTAEILDFVETLNQAFIAWITQLNTAQFVTLNAGKYQQQAAELAHALENHIVAAKPKARKEEVLIGGSRKVGRAFFYLFLGEAQMHLNTLKEAQKVIQPMSAALPSSASCRAAHTLSSNALTAGFETIGELARALEHWLDEFTGAWTEKHLALYGKVIQALEDGLEKAKNLQNPKSTRALVIELSKSTANMQVLAAQQAESAQQALAPTLKSKNQIALSENERLGSALSESEITLSEITLAVNNLPAAALEMPVAQENALPNEVKLDLQPVALGNALADFVAQTPPLHLESSPIEMVEIAPTPIILPSVPVAILETSVLATSVDQELLGLFIEEAAELVPQISRSLRNWKMVPHADAYPEEMQRALHTLKGSARTAGQTDLGDCVHALEDRVVHVLSHKPTLDDFDDMFITFDRISFLLDDLIKTQSVPYDESQPHITQASLEQQINESLAARHAEDSAVENAADADSDAVAPQLSALPLTEHIASTNTLPINAIPANATELTSQFLRVRAGMLDKLINDAGEVTILRSRMDREMQGFKQSSVDLSLSVGRLRTYLQELELEAESQLQSRLNLEKTSHSAFDPLEMDRFTRLQELTRLMTESLSDITTIQHGLSTHIDQTDVAIQQQGRMNRALQKGLMTVRMMPFSSISERLHRIVRQVSRALNKRVELTIDGEDIELDRSVLDKVGAPLEHLLRNAVVHGLEASEARVQLAKPETGQITLKVSVENDEITLMVSDDGRGVDLAKVKKLAIEKGLLVEQQAINDQTLMAIIFESGFSTEESVSQIAGRGVGLDAVRSDIAALNGRIDVSNLPSAGAMFTIYLPVTLSVTQVVMVRVDQQHFAIPSVMVEQVQTLKQQDLIAAYEAQKMQWAMHDYPLFFLAKLIGHTQYQPKSLAYTPVILLRSGQYRAAIHVDEVIGNQEIVMKSMGTQLTRVPGIVGATVMGDGAIVFVINPVQLSHREALNVGAAKRAPLLNVQPAKKTALVVDDSLTMRKVLSRVLEREGLDVVTANDGVDAIKKLQDATPDIILTDIEMPRMDGFEFASHIRDTPKLSHIPIIMISSRTAQKHRTMANEIGVNVFLGKPVQDEELMSHVQQLLQRVPEKVAPLIQA